MLLLGLVLASVWAAEMTPSNLSSSSSSSGAIAARSALAGRYEPGKMDQISRQISNLSLATEQAPLLQKLAVQVSNQGQWGRFVRLAGNYADQKEFKGPLKLALLTLLAHCQVIEWSSLLPTVKDLGQEELSVSLGEDSEEIALQPYPETVGIAKSDLDLLWLGRERLTTMPTGWLKDNLPKQDLLWPLILRLLPFLPQLSRQVNTPLGIGQLTVIRSLCMMLASRVLGVTVVQGLLEDLAVGEHWDMMQNGKLVRVARGEGELFAVRVLPNPMRNDVAAPRFYSRVIVGWAGPGLARWQDYHPISLSQIMARQWPVERALSVENNTPPQHLPEVSMPASLISVRRLADWISMLVAEDQDIGLHLHSRLDLMLHSMARHRELQHLVEKSKSLSASSPASPRPPSPSSISSLKSSSPRSVADSPRIDLAWQLIFKHTLVDILEACHQQHARLQAKRATHVHNELRARLLQFVEIERMQVEREFGPLRAMELFGPTPNFARHPCHQPIKEPLVQSTSRRGKQEKTTLKGEKPLKANSSSSKKKSRSSNVTPVNLPPPPLQKSSPPMAVKDDDGIRRAHSGGELSKSSSILVTTSLRRRKLSDQSGDRKAYEPLIDSGLSDSPGRSKLSQSDPVIEEAKPLSELQHFSVPVPRRRKSGEKQNLLDDY